MDNVVSLADRGRRLGFTQTTTYRRLAALLDYCHLEAGTGVVVGGPGVGKTASIRAWLEENEGVGAIATMGGRVRGSQPTAALAVIAEALGGELGYKLSAVELHRMIRALVKYGPPRRIPKHLEEGELARPSLLVIDEAHHLSQEVADCLRDLADELPIGLVYVGNAELVDRWFLGKAGKREASEQFLARFDVQLELELAEEDVLAILAYRGVTGKAERDFMLWAAQCPGHLHLVDRILKLASHRTGGRTPNLRDLQVAGAMRGLAP